MESFLIKAAQLIVALAFLVIVHEFGHYLMARIFGIKVEKFYLFFNPWFSLVKWHPKKKETELDKEGNPKASWRDTEYGIGWLPLGGYVKIAGMIDESMDKEQLAKPAQPWEFRSKPAWQRLMVMLGGVIFNFILAIIIYAGIAFHWGWKYVPFQGMDEGMEYAEEAKKIGFRNGDIPLTYDGNFADAAKEDIMLRLVEAKKVEVLRNHADTVGIAIPENFVLKLKDSGFMAPRVPVYVDRIVSGGAAAHAGVQEGDHIVKVGETPTPAFGELTEVLKAHAGKETAISVVRGTDTLQMYAEVPESAKLGIQLRKITDIYPTVTVNYNIFKAVPKGIELGTNMLSNYVGSMKYVVTTKEGAQSVGGFGAIGNMFPDHWNWYAFWEICAFLSVALAFMNILPIPALDGGHAFFLLWELVTRRKPSEKFMEYAQIAGMTFLILLLVYANGGDIVRAIMK